MCIILFSLHSSIVSIRYSRAVSRRSSCHTMSQQSASQNLGFLGAVRWGQWPHPLWLALGISLECSYFQLKGGDSICASLAFVILSKALRPLASAEKERVEKDLLLFFWYFRLLCPGSVGWGGWIIGREKPEIYNSRQCWDVRWKIQRGSDALVAEIVIPTFLLCVLSLSLLQAPRGPKWRVPVSQEASLR